MAGLMALLLQFFAKIPNTAPYPLLPTHRIASNFIGEYSLKRGSNIGILFLNALSAHATDTLLPYEASRGCHIRQPEFSLRVAIV
jgi:hypothetical protein